jgi:hypothetical protein
MKKLKIYEEEDCLILERTNQFNHATKRYFISQEGLVEALNEYPTLSEYEIECEHRLWAVIVQALQKA